jgi:hypothetical protein
MSPRSNFGNKQSFNQVSNKFLLHEPGKVRGANICPDFNAATQLILSVLLPDLRA